MHEPMIVNKDWTSWTYSLLCVYWPVFYIHFLILGYRFTKAAMQKVKIHNHFRS